VNQTPGFVAFCRRLIAEPARDYIAALEAMRDRGFAGLAPLTYHVGARFALRLARQKPTTHLGYRRRQ
jgi:hypothetical protein